MEALIKEISVLRKELEYLVMGKSALCEAEIVECSKRLDKLIDQYYLSIKKNSKYMSAI